MGGRALAVATGGSALMMILGQGCDRRAPSPEPPNVRSVSSATSAIATSPTSSTGPTPNKPGPETAPDEMVWIPAGEFSMGTTDEADDRPKELACTQPLADARPVHRVRLDGFWMDRTEVTNEAFARFVAATGYVTVAERAPTAAEFPNAPPENLIAGSVVFDPPKHAVPLDSQFRWWSYIRGASWRHPSGSGSDLSGREHYPVVQIAHEDARAYAAWAHKRLPTEAEFEYAARGGLTGRRYAWGDELRPGGRWMANTFQGHFPDHDVGEDGWSGLAPVASYPPNGYGLYDVAGNAWEWVSDWYRSDTYATLAARGVVSNPRGPDDSLDPAEPGTPKRVQRGGSFLCTTQYCSAYFVAARGKGEPSSGASHLGFRCVRDR